MNFYWSNNGIGLLVLRVAFGLGMMVHGIQKVNNFETLSQVFPDPLGVGSAMSLSLAIFAELFCSILLVVGLFTPLALVPLGITMLVAIFVAHGDDPWSKKELAFTYLSVYAALLCSGPGKLSLDYRLFGKNVRDSE
ncbi:MAG: DoxX family protein [Vulcanimicrobiota bacterium]